MANDGFIEFLSPGALTELKEASALVDKLATQISAISKFKAPKSPSGADNAGKKMADDLLAQEKAMEKARAGLQKLSDAQKKAESQRKASINAEWKAFEDAKRKEKEASDKLLATEIANAEKAAKAAIDKNNKIIQAAEKRAEREKQIEDKKAASIAASQQRQLERQAKIDERNSRTGANSAIPGMGSKIADLKAQEQAQQQAAKAAEREALANDKLNSAYNQLNSARTKAKNVLRDLIASESASTAEIRKAQKEFDVLDQKVRKADKAVGDFSKSVGNYKGALSGISNLMGAFGISTGIYLFADLVKNIYQTTKQLQSLDLALKMVSGSQSEFSNNQVFLTQLAEQYGIEIQGLTKNFTEFWVASKGKLEAEEIKEIFTSISKSVAVMGLSVEQQDSAFLALQQMMSKGTVQAEELKKQLGNALPGAVKAATMAYQALHPEMKVTEELFMKQMKAGKILSSELLPELAKAYEVLYGIENVNRAETLAAAQNRLSNSWTEMVRTMSESKTGGIQSFFKIVLEGLGAVTNKLIQMNQSWEQFYSKSEQLGASMAKGFFNEEMVNYQNRKTLTSKEKQDIKDRVSEINKEIVKAQQEGLGLSVGILQSEKDTLIEKMFYSDPANKENKLNEIKNRAKEAYTDFAKEFNKIQKEASQRASQMNFTDIGDDNRNDFIANYKSKKKQDLKMFMGTQQELINIANAELNALLKKKAASPIKEETEAERKARIKAAEDEERRLEELRKYAYERRISDLEREKEQIKDLRDLETTSLEDKLFLENAFAYKQIQINQTIYDEKVRLAKGNADLEKIALNELLTANENALSDSLSRQQKLKEDALKTDAQKTKDWYEKNPPMFFMTDEMRKQYDEAKKKIEDLKKEFADYIQSFEQEFFSNAGFADTFDFFVRVDENNKTMWDKLNENALSGKEKFAATFQAISQTAQEAFNFISEASQKNFDEEYTRLEEQKNIALLFAGESASARAEIEEQYEQKRKEIARREAKAKQQQAIFNIAIDTAQGIMATIGKKGFAGLPLALIIAAMGAAQIAMVASQKIPQYWKGTDNAEGGLAWTQEKGREIITDSQGRVKSLGSDKGAELTMLSKGDKVFTAEKSAMMFDNSLNSMLLNNGIVMPKIEVSMDTKILGSKLDKLSETIASKESFSIIRDAKGERIYQRKQNERKELLNNILNVKTYGV